MPAPKVTALTAGTFPRGGWRHLKPEPQKGHRMGCSLRSSGSSLCVFVSSQLTLHTLTCYEELVTFLQQSVQQV